MREATIRPGLLKRLTADTTRTAWPMGLPKRKPLPDVPIDMDLPGVGHVQWVSEASEPAAHWYYSAEWASFVWVKTRKGELDRWAWRDQQDYAPTSIDPSTVTVHTTRGDLPR